MIRNYNTRNLELIEGAIIGYDHKIFKVVKVENLSVTVASEKGDLLILSDMDWYPIRTNDEWFGNFISINGGFQICHFTTASRWLVRKSQMTYYLTLEDSEKITIPLMEVHMLSYWYYLLTNTLLEF